MMTKAASPRGFLTGDKIALRGARADDMERYRDWLADTQVTAYLEMGWRPLAERDLQATLRQLTEDPDTIAFVVVDKATGQAVGTCGLYMIQWVARRAQFNILIGEPSAWNKGFGTEALRLLVAYAFERLNLESIQLGVNAENKGAIRSYEKAGFVHEGRRRKFVYRDGRYYDSIMMSLLREEYEASKAPDHA